MSSLEEFSEFHGVHGAEVVSTSAPGHDGEVIVQVRYADTEPEVALLVRIPDREALEEALDSLASVSIGLASRAADDPGFASRTFVCCHCCTAVTLVGAGSAYAAGFCPSCLAKSAAGSLAGARKELVESATEAAHDEVSGYARMTTAACDAVDRLDTAEAVFRSCTRGQSAGG